MSDDLASTRVAEPARRPGSPRDPVRVALMGCGRWGANLARVLDQLREFDLVAVADPDPAALARVAGIAPGARPVRDIETVAGEVEAAVVCTPTGDHAGHGEILLRRGLHALIEKPMALEVESAKRLRRAAEAAGRHLAVGHQTLRHGCWERLVRLVRDGTIGAPRLIRASRRGPCDLERERGVLWSFGPHDVAMTLALMRRAPEDIDAEAFARDGRGRPAAARLSLGFPGGPRVELLLDGRERRRVRLFEVVGDQGRIVFDDAEPGGLLRLDVDGRGPEMLRVTADEPLARQCRGFWKAIRHDDTAGISDADQGVEVTRVLSAAEAAMGIAGTGESRLSSCASR